MERLTLLQVTVASVTLSLGIVAISFVLHARKLGVRPRSLRDRSASFLAALPGCSYVLIGLATIAMVTAVALQFFIPSEGLLESEGLYTLRMPDTLEVAALNPDDEVGEGDVIATFRSPQYEAEYSALKLQCDSLAAQRNIVERQPAEPDARLTLRQQELEAEYRHLRNALEQFAIERGEAQRERARDVQAKKGQIISLEGELTQLPQELIQRNAELAVKTENLRRAEDLFSKKTISREDYDEVKKEVTVLAAEIEKLRAREASARQEKTQAESDLREIEGLAQQQSLDNDRELTDLRRQLTAVAERRGELRTEMEQDRVKAEERKLAELERIRLELEQTNQRIEGLERTLKATAPIAGRVVYRNPSPGTVYKDDPLLVLAGPESLRYRVRLWTAQAKALRGRDKVWLEVPRPRRQQGDEELSPKHLVRRFVGRPLHFNTLEHEPSLTLVELACDPPDETVRELALGRSVPAQLIWIPPLYTLPLFVLGAIPAVVGTAGIAVTLARRRDRPSTREVTHEPRPANAHLRQSEPDSAALRLLGEQLREMIRDGELDLSLLATVEWVVDRHGLRGCRLLAEGLSEDGSLSDELAQLKQRTRMNGSPGHRAPFERLSALLQILAPGEVTPFRMATASRTSR